MPDTKTPPPVPTGTIVTPSSANNPLYGKLFHVIEEGVDWVKTEFKDIEHDILVIFKKKDVAVSAVAPKPEIPVESIPEPEPVVDGDSPDADKEAPVDGAPGTASTTVTTEAPTKDTSPIPAV